MAQHIRRAATTILLAFASLLATGCGPSGPELGTVSGTVTFQGKPLADAKIEFQPAEGSPSSARTDSNGRYKLMYTHERAGAMIGQHTVRITTGRTTTGPDGEALDIPEVLPAKYHAETELQREVKPGHNSFDFGL